MTIDAIAPGARVLCAVSGGVDSMYLLHRMTELAAQRGFTVGCAHFNHALRGAESDRDEAFVRAQCQRLNVPFYAGRGDVASVRGMGTEGAARQLRYAFLTDCAAAHGYVDGVRYSNYTSLEEYMAKPHIHECGRTLSMQEKLEEEIFLGFRKRSGVNVSEIDQKYGIDFGSKYRHILDKYSDFIEKTPSGYTFNLKGTLISNIILSEFI